MVRQAFWIVLLATLAGASAGPRAANAANARTQTAAGNTQFLLFNLPPAGSYDVRRNGASIGSISAGPSGTASLQSPSQTGDRFEFTLTGVQPVTPAAPAAFAATGTTTGCVGVAWNTPTPTDYVTDYRLLWGTGTGVYTDSLSIGRLDVVVAGGRSSYTACGLPSGTFHFALRAHNAFDLWSARSAASTTTISNTTTAPPPPPTNVKVVENGFGCAQVTWNKVGDPTVVGYRVYFGALPRNQAAYTDSVEAGNASSALRCGLAGGTYYFSLRSYTGAGLVSGFSREVSLAAQGVDVTGPTLSQRTPTPGATGIPLDATVFFTTKDDKTGVNPSSVQVWVDSQPCSPVVSPSSGGYAVQCDPPGDLPANSDVRVDVQLSDNATPPNVSTRNWTFTTGSSTANDITAPVLQIMAPAAGATGVDARPTIELSIVDSGLGVDLSSVQMLVNDAAVPFMVEGTQASARILYRPDTAFEAGSQVRVHVSACDRATPPNCAPPVDFTFTVTESQTVVGNSPGAIVPDGFWADDPHKPLEVRNLHRAWTVRIFDATGVAVRRFESADDGTTWAWDFKNDDGRRVAPALYLVRVTDASGSVQTAGRFLVQSER